MKAKIDVNASCYNCGIKYECKYHLSLDEKDTVKKLCDKWVYDEWIFGFSALDVALKKYGMSPNADFDIRLVMSKPNIKWDNEPKRRFKVVAKHNNKTAKRNMLPRKLRKKIIFATSAQRAIKEYEEHLISAGFLVEPEPLYNVSNGNFYYVEAKDIDEGYSTGYTAIITANKT